MTTMMARIINFVLEWQHLTECTFLSNLSDSGLLFYGGEDLGSFAGWSKNLKATCMSSQEKTKLAKFPQISLNSTGPLVLKHPGLLTLLRRWGP